MTLTLSIPSDKVRLLLRKFQAYTLAFGKTFDFSVHMQSNSSFRFRDDNGFFDITTVVSGNKSKTSHMQFTITLPTPNSEVSESMRAHKNMKGKAVALLAAFHQIARQEGEKYGFDVDYNHKLSQFVPKDVSAKWGNWALGEIERKYPQEGFNPFAMMMGGTSTAPNKATYQVMHVEQDGSTHSFAGGTLGAYLSTDPT